MGLKTGPNWGPFWARFGILMLLPSAPLLTGLASILVVLTTWKAIPNALDPCAKRP